MAQKTHAQILSDIAAKVVAQHKGQCACNSDTGIFDHPAEGICRGVVGEFWTPDLQARVAAAKEIDHTPDWDYRLEERWQG
jgi:hypothetical protein